MLINNDNNNNQKRVQCLRDGVEVEGVGILFLHKT
jgi:hypothetical protein